MRRLRAAPVRHRYQSAIITEALQFALALAFLGHFLPVAKLDRIIGVFNGLDPGLNGSLIVIDLIAKAPQDNNQAFLVFLVQRPEVLKHFVRNLGPAFWAGSRDFNLLLDFLN